MNISPDIIDMVCQRKLALYFLLSSFKTSKKDFKVDREKSKVRLTKYGMYVTTRGISILGEVRNVANSRPTQQLLLYKFHDFLAVFALAHSKINQIA